MDDEFPGNRKSGKRPQNGPKEKSIEKVVTGEVILRKKSLGKRFRENFTGDDTRSVIAHVIWEVGVPRIKDLMFSAVTEGFERKLYGESRSANRHGGYRPG